MMRARSLAQWKDAMRMRALVTSNYTYADRAGNIFNLWNAALPLLPHPAGRRPRDAGARDARSVDASTSRSRRCRSSAIRRGGYVHNENDSPHFANVRRRLNLVNAYPNIEPPTLRLRSQHAIQLIGGNRKFSLEDVVRLKHSYRMLLADRVKPRSDRARYARAKPTGDVADRAGVAAPLEQHRGAAGSRGATLFEIWYQRYCAGPPADGDLRARRGRKPIRCARRAGSPIPRAPRRRSRGRSEETAKRHGRWDVAWGDVHRVRRGSWTCRSAVAPA